MGWLHGLLITKVEAAALRRDAVRPADLSRHRALLHQRRHRRLHLRRHASRPGMADDGPHVRAIPHTFIAVHRARRRSCGSCCTARCSAAISSRSARTRRRRAIPASAPTASSSPPTSSAAALTAIVGDLLRHVHALDLALLARQLLRALRDRGGRARRLLAARRRGLDRRRRARHHPAAGAAEPGQPARHSVLAQFRGDGLASS